MGQIRTVHKLNTGMRNVAIYNMCLSLVTVGTVGQIRTVHNLNCGIGNVATYELYICQILNPFKIREYVKIGQD